jgi:hypothetical protein
MIYLSGNEKPAVTVTRLCKRCRWARPAWHALPIALLLPFLWREFWYLATCRHPTSVDPPLRDYVGGKPMKPRRLAYNVRAPLTTATGVDRRRAIGNSDDEHDSAVQGIAAGRRSRKTAVRRDHPVQWYTATKFMWWPGRARVARLRSTIRRRRRTDWRPAQRVFSEGAVTRHYGLPISHRRGRCMPDSATRRRSGASRRVSYSRLR